MGFIMSVAHDNQRATRALHGYAELKYKSCDRHATAIHVNAECCSCASLARNTPVPSKGGSPNSHHCYTESGVSLNDGQLASSLQLDR